MGKVVTQVVALAAGAAVSFYLGPGGFAVFETFGATMAGGLAGMATGMIGGVLLGGSAKAKSESLGSEAQDRKLMLRSSIESRKIPYGLVKVSGPLALKATTGTTKEYLHLGVPVSTREVAGIDEVWFDDTLSTDSRIASFNRVKKHLGAPSQEADADLVAEVPGWTAQHRGRGIAYLYARAKYDTTAWPNSLKNVLGLVRGVYIYDPRAATVAIATSSAASPALLTTSTAHGLSVGDWIFVRGHSAALAKFYVVATAPSPTSLTLLNPVTGAAMALAAGGAGGTISKMAWTHNAALCILDYLLWTDGLNANEDEIHWDSWIASANICEEQVALGASATLTANAGTDVVTLSAPVPWATGLSVRLSSSVTLPAPLAAETTYYWIRLTALTGKLAATSEDAGYGLGIDLTSAGSGAHTLSCALPATADAGADTITTASPAYWSTGDGVRFLSGTPPTGLSLGTTYFWVRTGDSTGKLASTFANAMSGAALDLADAGTGLTIARVSQPRYTANGVVDLGKKPIDIMEQLLTCCGGVMPYLQGKYRLHAAAAGVPLATALTESQLRGSLKIRPRPPKREVYNAVRGTFVDPAQLWQPTDFVPQLSSGYEAEDGGERIYKDKELPFTTDGVMAQRLVKMDLERARQGITVDYPANLSALPIALWDVVPLSIANLGWSRKAFRVLGWTLAEAGGVDLVLQEEAAEVYDWSPGEATHADPAPNTLLANPWDVAPPTGLALASGTEVLSIRGDGTVQTRLRVGWTAPADAFVLSGGHIEVQLRRSVDTAWMPAAIVAGADVEVYLFDVEDGTAYDVRLRAVNGLGAASAWVQGLGHVVLGKSAPPSDVASFSVQQNGEVCTFQYGAVPDMDLGGYEMRFCARNAFDWDKGTVITRLTRGTLITNAALPPGSWTVGIKAQDSSGNYSLHAKTYDITVNTLSSVISAQAQHPAWPGVRTNMIKHHTGVLIPMSQFTAAELGLRVFTEFVPDPVDSCSYESPEQDAAFDDPRARVWSALSGSAGPGEPAAPGLALELAQRASGGSYGEYVPWAGGAIVHRYYKARVRPDLSSGVGTLDAMTLTADAVDFSQQGSVTVPAGGLAITFPKAHHALPNVQLTPGGSAALIPTRTSLSPTGMTIVMRDITGADVGGPCDWKTTGP